MLALRLLRLSAIILFVYSVKARYAAAPCGFSTVTTGAFSSISNGNTHVMQGSGLPVF